MSKIVSWNLNQKDDFIVITSKDLKRYQYKDTKEDKFELKSSFDLNQGIVKCFSWNPKYFFKEDSYLALGLNNGNIILYDLQNNEIMKEFSLKSYPRPSNCISWNPIQTNYIAIGVEKYKNMSSIIIWDFNTRGEKSTYLKDQFSLQTKPYEIVQNPQFEFYSESVTSLAWIPNQSTCLFSGIYKYIKLFDFRDLKKTSTSLLAHNGYVKGIQFDPNDLFKFITWSDTDSIIKLWDTRKLNEPMKLIHTNLKNPNFIYENFSNSSIISSIDKNENIIKLWDLSDSKRLEFKYSIYKNIYTNEPISSISIHPFQNNLILTNTISDQIKIIKTKSHFSSSFHSNGNLYSFEKIEKNQESFEINDIMFSRAFKGIGIENQKNIKISKESNEIDKIFLFEWMERFKKLNQEMDRKIEDYIYPSVEYLLNKEEKEGYLIDKNQFKIFKILNKKEEREMNGFQIFDRNILFIYDWLDMTFNDDKSTRTFAKYIFNLNLSKATQILFSLDQSSYKYLAFSLFKYNQDTRDQFRDLFQNEKLDDPYLRVAIGFLCSKNNDYSCILYENQISFHDRLSFALKYLSNDLLIQYLLKMKDYFILNGDLQGLVLTGLNSNETIQLLQNYIDKTNDIQIPCLIMCQLPIKEKQVLFWLETYRDLLDKWSLWEQRTLFDIEISRLKNIESNHIIIKCKFCNQTISNVSKNQKTRNFRKYVQNNSNSTSCKNCNKSLPSCSICQLPFGSSNYCFGENNSKKFDNLDYSMVWCTQCKHVGHLKHLKEWFSIQKECPVSDCKCKCYF